MGDALVDCTVPIRHPVSTLLFSHSCVNPLFLSEPMLEEHDHIDGGVDSDGE
jgi:hypothetical protein